MMVYSSGVEPPASGFWFSSFSGLRISPSTQHRRQNPLLNGETTLYCQEHPEKFTELYREDGSGRWR